MLRFIIGRSGSGKTERLYRDIRDTLESGFGGNVLLIVPEQFTFETERALLSAMPKGGCLHVDVCGFDRLIFRVLAETGGLARTFLSRQGKDMLIRKVMDDTDTVLGSFGRAAKQVGFAGVCGEWFATFKRSAITPEMLEDASKKVGDSALERKLSDLSRIFQSVERHLSLAYLDLEDAYRLFIANAPESEFLRGARVYVDGFDQLARQDYDMLEAVMLCAKELTVTLRIPGEKDADAHIFAPERFVMETLMEISARNGVPRSVIEPGLQVKRAAALRYLERDLFSARTIERAIDDSIRIYECQDAATEAVRAARRVCALVRSGLRYRDIAVLISDFSVYAPYIARSFQEHGIPFFLDSKRPMLSHSISDFLLAATSAAVLGFRPYDMQRIVKSGYAITDEDIAERMSIYLLRYGIRAYEFTQPFTRGNEGEALEEARQSLLEPLIKYRDALKRNATARMSAQALYRYMEAVGLSEQLSRLAVRLKDEKRYDLARENAQVWDILMQTLDQIVVIFGDEPLPKERFLSLLEEGIRTRTVGVIPTTADQVLVGDIGRTISGRMKVVMALGCNEGALPARHADDDLLGENECAALKELGLAGWPDNSQKEARERLDIYVAFARATERLELSYALSSGGEALAPSPLIDRIRALFPGIETSEDDENELFAPRASFGPLVSALRGLGDSGETRVEWAEQAYAWYAKTPPWDAALSRADMALTMRGGTEALPSALARELFTRTHTSSSRIETFARCPFQHFVKYGLSPDVRGEFVPKAPDVGSFLHGALDALTREIAQRGLDWTQISQEDIDELIETLWEPMLEGFQNGLLAHSARNLLLSRKLKRMLSRCMYAAARQIASGDFRPVGSELRIGENGAYPPLELTLESGDTLPLTGVIDRVDALRHNGETYYQIIDYKTGAATLSLSELYFGVKPQMPLYMKAVLNASEGAKPAGMLYFHVDDPFAENLQELEKKFRMNGLLLKDASVLRAMDARNSGGVVSARVKKDGGVSGSGTLEQGDLLLALDRTKELSERLLSLAQGGKASARPLKRGNKAACDSCDFAPICAFDEQIEGFRYNVTPSLSETEFLARLRNGKGSV